MKQVGPAEVSGTGWWYKSCLYPTDPASLPGVRLWFGPILRKPLALRVPPPSSPLAAARARLGRWGCLGPYPRGSLRRTSAVAFLSLLYSKRRGKESVSEYYGAVVGCGKGSESGKNILIGCLSATRCFPLLPLETSTHNFPVISERPFKLSSEVPATIGPHSRRASTFDSSIFPDFSSYLSDERSEELLYILSVPTCFCGH